MVIDFLVFTLKFLGLVFLLGLLLQLILTIFIEVPRIRKERLQREKEISNAILKAIEEGKITETIKLVNDDDMFEDN